MPGVSFCVIPKNVGKGNLEGEGGVRSLENAPILERLLDSSARIAIDII
jgi:hypothetical protein